MWYQQNKSQRANKTFFAHNSYSSLPLCSSSCCCPRYTFISPQAGKTFIKMNLKSTGKMQLREISANILHNKARRDWQGGGERGTLDRGICRVYSAIWIWIYCCCIVAAAYRQTLLQRYMLPITHFPLRFLIKILRLFFPSNFCFCSSIFMPLTTDCLSLRAPRTVPPCPLPPCQLSHVRLNKKNQKGLDARVAAPSPVAVVVVGFELSLLCWFIFIFIAIYDEPMWECVCVCLCVDTSPLANKS